MSSKHYLAKRYGSTKSSNFTKPMMSVQGKDKETLLEVAGVGENRPMMS